MHANTSRILVVTGASRGIGAATARCAAHAGWDIVINARQNRAAAEAVACYVRAAGRRALVVMADVSTEAGVTSLFDATDRESLSVALSAQTGHPIPWTVLRRAIDDAIKARWLELAPPAHLSANLSSGPPWEPKPGEARPSCAGAVNRPSPRRAGRVLRMARFLRGCEPPGAGTQPQIPDGSRF